MTHFTSLMYYLPTKPSITAQYLKGGPEYTVFAKETETARARTQEYGCQLPEGLPGDLDGDPGRDHRHHDTERRAAAGPGHDFGDPEGRRGLTAYPRVARLRSTWKSGPAPAVTAGSRPAAWGSSCPA